jgi:putative transposase
MGPDPAEELALWRYHLIAEALSRRIGSGERGLIVRRLAGQEHMGPDGEARVISRNTIDRWIRAYRQHGLVGLRDRPRSDAGTCRRYPELIAEAAKLRLEQPARSAAHIAEVLSVRHGVRVSERTVREQLQKRGLTRAELLKDERRFGRYEAAEPNERWILDVLVGPWIPSPKARGSQRARLFLIVDDHSRLAVHGRWFGNETLRAGQEVLHTAILRRGLPDQLYTDNGHVFAGHELVRSCAILGIRLIHSRPYMPEGRGKLERLLRVIRERFLLEVEQTGIASLAELNDRWLAWVERYLNTRRHAETGISPLERFQKGRHRQADSELLRQAFLWAARRRVTRTATVSLQGNQYQVDGALVGRWLELRYRPEDLSNIEVWLGDRQFGVALPLAIQRHVHTQLPPSPRPTAEPTGVDYLGQVLADYEAEDARPISFRDLGREEPDAQLENDTDEPDEEDPAR